MKRFFIVLAVSFVSCVHEDPSLTVGFVGDILLDRGVRTEIQRRGIGQFYQEIGNQLGTYDVLIGNLECPLTQYDLPVDKKFVFKADTLNAFYLKSLGFTHLSLANNHSYDQGRTGMQQTISVLKNQQIVPLGYGPIRSKSCVPTLIEKHGIKLAIFSAVTLALENWTPLDSALCMCQENHQELVSRIKRFNDENPSFSIVTFLHWGIEHSSRASPDQKFLAHALIDAGADFVIGHHPHVLQPIESYKGKTIAYSLGNFIFDQNKEPNRQSLLIELYFDGKEYSVRTYHFQISKCIPYKVKS